MFFLVTLTVILSIDFNNPRDIKVWGIKTYTRNLGIIYYFQLNFYSLLLRNSSTVGHTVSLMEKKTKETTHALVIYFHTRIQLLWHSVFFLRIRTNLSPNTFDFCHIKKISTFSLVHFQTLQFVLIIYSEKT